MRQNRILFFSIVIIFAGFLSVVTPVSAQEAVGVKVAPSIIEDRVELGQVLVSTIRVSNLGKATATYYFSKRDISAVRDDGSPVFAEENEPTGYEVSSWISMPGESVTVAAGETKEIPVTIRVPADASPGSHLGGIFFLNKAPKLRENGTSVGYQVGTIINLRMAGEALEDARIRDFFTDRSVYGKADITFTTTVENKGNTVIRPRGPITIQGLFGKITDIPRINDDASVVTPGATRSFKTTWKPKQFMIGRYQAIMSLVYGEKETGLKTVTSTVSFWVLPMKVIAPVIGGLLLIILVGYVGVRFIVRRKVAALYEGAGGRSERVDTRRETAPLSRLTVIAVALLSLIVLFLLVLFFFFV
jgi:hypothetical protein